MKKRLALVGIVVMVGIGLWALFSNSAFAPAPTGLRLTTTQQIAIDEVSINVAIAGTPTLRERGLSGVSGLAPDEGMLFVFEEDGQHSFWMKDMLFSIDILWITSNGAVVHIERDVSPDSFPRVFISDTPARYVLEVPAGFATEHGIEVGSKLDF